jgi:pimeloyl-ACP methyl ester carboxylesterase
MRRPLAISLSLFALAGCSSDPAPLPVPDAGPPSIEALYGAAASSFLTPYPSDRYTFPDATTATKRRVLLDATTTADPFIAAYPVTAQELSAMDGFSTAGGVIVSFSAPIDIHGIVTDEAAEPPITDPPRDASAYTKKGSPFLLVDVDPLSPEHGTARGLIPRWWAQAKDDYFTTDEFTLVAQPATPLLPGTRYAFVVTSALAAASGGGVTRSAATEALINGGDTSAYGDEVRAALGEIEKSTGVARDDVRLVTAFTTASILDESLATAKRARTQPPPAILEDWTVETPIAAPDKRARFRAVFEAPEYRKPLPDGKWEIKDGAPVAQKKVGLEVFLAFSDATKSGPRPIVIFAHGLGGTKDGNWGTSERLADLNAAVIAIDSPEHGSRAADPKTDPLLASFSFFGVDPVTQSFDIGRARDNFRQMSSDQLELVRLVDSLGKLDILPIGAPDGIPDLDVSRILYIGHSFGSVQGPAIFATAPEIHQAVWNVGGDGLMTLLRDSGTFSILVNSLKPPHTADGALGRFFAISQAIVDPGDPLNYARFGTQLAAPGVVGWKARDVLLQEVVDDSIVPNSTSEALARAAGLVLADPIRPISGLPSGAAPLTGNLASGATGVIAQFDKIEGGQLATHGELIFSPEARTQYVEFFKSGLANPHATVAPAYPK